TNINTDPYFLIFDMNTLYYIWVADTVNEEKIIVWKHNKQDGGQVNTKLDTPIINPSSETIASNEPEEDKLNPEDYEVIAYEDIMRDRSGKMLTKHTFYAEVLQYQEEDDFAYALLMRNGD